MVFSVDLWMGMRMLAHGTIRDDAMRHDTRRRRCALAICAYPAFTTGSMDGRMIPTDSSEMNVNKNP